MHTKAEPSREYTSIVYISLYLFKVCKQECVRCSMQFKIKSTWKITKCSSFASWLGLLAPNGGKERERESNRAINRSLLKYHSQDNFWTILLISHFVFVIFGCYSNLLVDSLTHTQSILETFRAFPLPLLALAPYTSLLLCVRLSELRANEFAFSMWFNTSAVAANFCVAFAAHTLTNALTAFLFEWWKEHF